MKNITKRAASIFAVMIALLSFGLNIHASDIAITSESAILINKDTLEVIYEKNANKRLPMASTTKIMTAYVALRYFVPEEKMTIPHDAVGIEGTSASLKEGEIYTLEALLYALLLQSANDAAAAIAINVAGDIDSFASLMNREASLLGLSDTHFTNPHGLPDDEHYTTARELALLTAKALENECIQKITATKKATIVSESGVRRCFYNHNKMLSGYYGADGVKTGFTKASGRCLVSSATRDGVSLIAVTLHSHDDWREHTAMLDYGFCQQNKNN